jgi:leucyl-tRNA synthetase
VTRLPLRQWVLNIPEYADRLVEGLDEKGPGGESGESGERVLDWPKGTIQAQKKWIGKSEGCEITFDADEGTDHVPITVFTTRCDTIYGVTYLSLAPEHPLIPSLTTPDNKLRVEEYVNATSKRSDMDRTANNVKTGVFTGSYVIHPLNEERIPVWVADYVLGSYGSGAVMAVPGHDDRDYEFAKKYGLRVKNVVEPVNGSSVDDAHDDNVEPSAFTDHGITVNSSPDINGLTTAETKIAVAAKLNDRNKGGDKIQYKLRDWVFSRQRYWGEPIPIYFPIKIDGDKSPKECDPSEFTICYDQPIPVPESELPLTLPDMEDFTPGDDPAGCLARATDWRYFQKDGMWYARETNTMPQWAGSCWYYLRFIDPKNSDAPWSKEADAAWMPVDLYVGGAEHAVLHLLYARFWHQVLFDAGLTKHPEPFKKLVHQGMILGSDNEKMSKSRGNVVNPDDVVKETGADSLRLYEMFMGPLEAVKPWQTSQVQGVVRFMRRVWTVCEKTAGGGGGGGGVQGGEEADETKRLLHQTMKKVTGDVESMSFNTAIAALMVLANHLNGLEKPATRDTMEKFAIMLSPFAPHLAEEMWQSLGNGETLAYEPWVEYDEALCVETTVVMGVQVNGKVRGEISIAKDEEDEKVAMGLAMAVEKIKLLLDGKDVKKVIYRPGRILNIIAK